MRVLHKSFTKVWKLKFSNIGALAILVFEIARHHSEFATAVVDQVLEDIRAGLEVRASRLAAQSSLSTGADLLCRS